MKTKIRKYIRIGSWSVVITAMVLIALQLCWPSDRFLPNQVVDGQKVGFARYDDVSNFLRENYGRQAVKLMAGTITAGEMPATELGMKVSVDNQISAASYSLRERLIPGSFIVKMLTPNQERPEIALDTAVVGDYLEKNYDTICTVAPVNARLTVTDSDFKLVDDQPGLKCNERAFMSDLLTASISLTEPTQVQISGTKVPAAVTAAQVQPLYGSMKQRLDDGVKLKVDTNRTVTVREPDVITWLRVNTNRVGYPSIAINQTKLNEYAERIIAPLVYKKPGVTLVSQKNGVEVSRTPGRPGKELDAKALARKLTSEFNKTYKGVAKAIEVPTKSAAPTIQEKNSYTKNREGLSKLMQTEVTSNKQHVTVIDLSGRNMSMARNGDDEIVAPEAAKIINGYLMLTAVADNGMDMSSDVGNISLSECFDGTMDGSNTDCAADFLNKVGLTAAQDKLDEAGLNDTILSYDTVRTTTNDLASLLRGVVKKTLLKDSLRTRFLSTLDASGVVGQAANTDEKSSVLRAAKVVTNSRGTYVLVAATTDKADVMDKIVSSIDKLFE